MGEVYQPKKKKKNFLGESVVFMFGDIEVEQMVFGCSERLHVDVKKTYANIFHGKFLGTWKYGKMMLPHLTIMIDLS